MQAAAAVLSLYGLRRCKAVATLKNASYKPKRVAATAGAVSGSNCCVYTMPVLCIVSSWSLLALFAFRLQFHRLLSSPFQSTTVSE